ncbi:conserved hypothetical protein, similar to yjgH of E. coli (plasmid) [Aromatoleum aromaticum EbN1]|uniref:Uncharacterized protein n=1 Tax=Aromatoleum aromaticum (strain DSM 19018 / LMG 30748 / EbN1) TaxID=76114 RepID=Q5NW78_AROAE|nr:RidA family protein [Aromatoleum aromaticum]CAI10686.1 conserved hypothetical protein, similar to yjgH of E. coli [Aromatoleum aromaticum EbN1]
MSKQGRKLLNPAGIEALSRRLGFSQAVQVGDTIWVSGQVGWDDEGNIAEGIKEQSRLALKNLRRVLAEAGATLDDIVELVTFQVDMSDLAAFAQVKSELMPNAYPAWTAVGTTALAFPALLIEVRATAVRHCLDQSAKP